MTQPSDRARKAAALVRLLRRLAPDDGTCALRMKQTEDAFTVNRAIREAADMIERETPGFAAGVEALDREITAWAFANDIDGAARNDLMRRIRALTPAPPADYLTRAHAQIASGQSQENTVLDGAAPPASEGLDADEKQSRLLHKALIASMESFVPPLDVKHPTGER